MFKFIRKHPVSVFLSLLLHVLIIVIFAVKWSETEEVKVSLNAQKQNEPIKNVKQIAKAEQLKTFAVDSTQVKEKLAQIKAEQEARLKEQEMLKQLTQKERERLKELQKKQSAEKAKAEKAKKLAEAERKKADQARKKAEKAKLAAAEAEKQRKAEKAKAKQAEQQRLAEEKKKQQIEAEVARKAEEKKALEKAAADAKKLKEQQEREAALQKQLAEEAAEQRAEQKRKQLLSLRQTYISSITARVKDNWRTPAKISPNAQCDLKITQTPKGTITSVKVLNCNSEANRQFQQAAEKAVYRAQPLPQPPVPELFEREITFEFKP